MKSYKITTTDGKEYIVDQSSAQRVGEAIARNLSHITVKVNNSSLLLKVSHIVKMEEEKSIVAKPLKLQVGQFSRADFNGNGYKKFQEMKMKLLKRKI